MYQPEFPTVPFRLGLYPVVDSVLWIERLLSAVDYELVDVQRDLDLEARYCADRRDGLSVMHGFGIARARKR